MRTVAARVSHLGWVLFCLLFCLRPADLPAQNNGIEIDLVLSPRLEKAQVLGLSDLSTQNRSGAKLFDLVIRNTTSRRQEDLYFTIRFSADKVGLIAEITQVQERPFSLDPFQVVVADNNQLRTNIPGIEEVISLTGGLTGMGEEFFNDLKGATNLPSDEYTLELAVYQNNNSRNGGTRVAETVRTVGGGLVEEIGDLYLVQPGDVLGSGAVINSTLPVFRWEGPFNIQYRLLVVRADGQNSPEALLQSAASSEPVLVDGRSSGGSLLENEILDARVNNISFSMPPNGVQKLEPGGTYYWQVLALRETISGTSTTSSEIWSFTVSDPGSEITGGALNDQLKSILKQLLGEERYEELERQNFRFVSITIDGQTYEGPSAIQKLIEIQQKRNNGNISIIEQ